MLKYFPCLLTLALVSPLVAFAAGSDDAAEAEANTDGEVMLGEPGPRCISVHRVRNTRVLDGQNIVFELSGKEAYVNHLPRSCPSLGFEKRFAFSSRISQYCDTDTITVITNMGRGATCGLGKFYQYIPPEDFEAPADAGKLEPVEN